MIKSWVRRFLTTTADIPGTWTRSGPDAFQDSSLGICRTESSNGDSFYATISGIGEIRVSVLTGGDPASTYDFARNLLVHLPQQDKWYRRFGASDMYDFHLKLGPSPKVSVRELARRLELSWIQLWNPCAGGAIVWYSAGNLLDGARLGVQLDEYRRYCGGGCG